MTPPFDQSLDLAQEEQYRLCQDRIRHYQLQWSISLDAACESREAAEAMLHHERWEYKFAALFMLSSYWGVTLPVADICESLASADGELQLRTQAIVCLLSYYSNTHNRKVAKLCSSLISDEAQDAELRFAAYYALHCLFVPLHSRPLPMSFRFPDDVDWVLVNKYR